MEVIKAIPRKMLPHTVSYTRENKDADDFWQECAESEGFTVLKHVKMEPSSKIVRDKNNAEIQLAATLFYDCKNSKPRGISFAKDDVIVFNGQKHQIKTIEVLYAGRNPHHYEMGLIKRA